MTTTIKLLDYYNNSNINFYNSTNTLLAKTGSINTTNGGANLVYYYNYQTGAKTSRAALVIPPNSSTDTITLKFTSIPTVATSRYSFIGTFGIQQQIPNNSLGVTVTISVSGNQIDTGDSTSTTLSTFDVLQNSVESVNIPLNTWPLRGSFTLSITIANKASNNYYNNILLSSCYLVPNGNRPVLGIAQSNLIQSWRYTNGLTVAQTITNIGALGATWIRTDIRDSSLASTFSSVVSACKTAGLNVLAVIDIASEDYTGSNGNVTNNNATFTSKCGYSGGSQRVSLIDITNFQTRISNYLTDLTNNGLLVDAFEVMNEPDWVCFNGDVPLTSNPPANSVASYWTHMGDMIQAIYPLIKAYNPNAYIISGGLACVRTSTTGSIPDPWNILLNWKTTDNNNVSEYLDGYGLHFYSLNAGSINNLIGNFTLTLPLWITETNSSDGSLTDSVKYTQMRSMLDTYNSTNVQIAAIFIYDYINGGSPYDIYSSGSNAGYSKIFTQYNSLL